MGKLIRSHRYHLFNPDMSLHHVITLCVSNKVHRLWYIEEEIVLGVVSLADILIFIVGSVDHLADDDLLVLEE